MYPLGGNPICVCNNRPTMTETIDTLVAKAQQGDTGAFGELVRRHSAPMQSYVLGRVRDHAWADDLAQEVFIAAFQGIDTLHDARRFGPWLYGIADNLVAMWMRRTMRRRGLFVDTPDPDSERSMHQPAPLTAQTATDSPGHSEAMVAAMDGLTPNSAIAVALHYRDGLPQRDCAEFLGITLKAFESRLSRAREHLKKGIPDMTHDDLRDGSLDDVFGDRVAEEIDKLVSVVGGPYRREPVEAAEERLRLLFARNEERLDDLISDASTPSDIRAAARMVLSLGQAGIRRALVLAMSGNESIRRNALASLPYPFEGIWSEGTHMYETLEAIHDSDFSDGQKTGLLIDIARRPSTLAGIWSKQERSRAAEDSPYYAEMLLTYGDAAIAALVGALRTEADAPGNASPDRPGDGPPDKWLVRALALFGTQGAEAALPLLDEGDAPARAAIAVARCLGESRQWLWKHIASGGWGGGSWKDINDRDVPLLNRCFGTVWVVQPSRIDPDGLRRVGKRLSRMLSRDDAPALRRAAAMALGCYPDAVALEPLSALLAGEDDGLATDAARSLGMWCAPDRVEPLVQAVETAATPVRAAAHQSLVQLLTAYAQEAPVLSSRSPEDLPDALHEERQAAGLLLDEFARLGDRIRSAREGAAAGPDLSAGQRKALSESGVWEKLLPRLVSPPEERPEPPPATERLAELRRRAKAYHKAHPEVSAPFRGPRPLLDVELGAVMRELPEDRRYTEREMTVAAARVCGRGDVAKRRLYEEWWMERDGREYWFTERGRRAWRMERLLAGG